MDKRILELLELVAAEGITLPMPVKEILALEDAGHVVDLLTGEVLELEADQPYEWEWTVYGQTVAHLLKVRGEAW